MPASVPPPTALQFGPRRRSAGRRRHHRPDPGLPQPEPRFDVRPTTQDQLKGNALLARAIVILSDKPYASGHDLNARPQLVIEASAKDSARILHDLLAFEEQESYAFLQHNHHPKMEEKIRSASK